MLLRPASELTPRPVEWLWPGCLPLGSLAILDGDPGLGKSLVTIDLCARLTTGQPFPDGAASPGPAAVILLYEEDPENIMLARMRIAGTDMARAFPWPHDADPGPPMLPSEIACLDQVLNETHAKLVIIDPIVAFLDPSVNISSHASVHRALKPLLRLAEKHRCVILLVRHLNKRSGDHALYRGGGSIAFLAMCRLAWLAGNDPRAEDHYVLAQNKNNNGPQPSLAYALPSDTARVEWLGTSPWIARDLGGRRRPSPEFDRACAFLRTFLKDGPRPSREVRQAARTLGLAEATLRRAREDIPLGHRRVVSNRRAFTYWLLPGQELPQEILQKSDTPDLDAFLEDLEKRFPRRKSRDDDDGERVA
jgi:hypothetical protein